jgi:hypothetical protein
MQEISKSEACAQDLRVGDHKFNTLRTLFERLPGQTTQEKMISLLLSTGHSPHEIVTAFKTTPSERTIYRQKDRLANDFLLVSKT